MALRSQWSTGFLVNTGQDHVLVTAAHVLDRLTGLQKPEAGGRKVVGVMIEHRRHKGVFIATDIAAVILLLREYYEASSKGKASSMNVD
jgi:hypothetical protein